MGFRSRSAVTMILAGVGLLLSGVVAASNMGFALNAASDLQRPGTPRPTCTACRGLSTTSRCRSGMRSTVAAAVTSTCAYSTPLYTSWVTSSTPTRAARALMAIAYVTPGAATATAARRAAPSSARCTTTRHRTSARTMSTAFARKMSSWATRPAPRGTLASRDPAPSEPPWTRSEGG